MKDIGSWFPRFILGSLVGVVSLTGVARADVAPPAGQKYAQYGFSVDNIASFPDWVLVGYPCTISSGTPYQQGTVITTSAVVNVGRRGGTCAMYAMKQSEWTSWRAANPAPAAYENDTKLGELVKSGKVLTCQGGPQPRFLVASTAPDTITDTLHIEKLDGATCTLTLKTQEDPGQQTKPTPIVLNCGISGGTGSSGHAMWGFAIAALATMQRRARRKQTPRA